MNDFTKEELELLIKLTREDIEWHEKYKEDKSKYLKLDKKLQSMLDKQSND